MPTASTDAAPATEPGAGGARAAALGVVEAFNGGGAEAVDRVFDPAYRSLTAPFPGTDATREGVKRQIELLRRALPDLRVETREVIARGDRVYLRWTLEGTHTGGELLGVPPSGRRVTHYGQELFRLAGGRIVERHGHEDFAELRARLAAAGDDEGAGGGAECGVLSAEC
ncbi:MAG TPA: ester cyclase [Longimicrobium sp.]|nr:ester cyclase [Longimicrobium sp.]